MNKSAVIDGPYRLVLERSWDNRPACGFIMLNPSTADATTDDPTIRRCIGFAKSWGFGGLVVLNLFAFRATNPKELERAYNPVGIFNDPTIFEYTRAQVCGTIVAAWGAHRVMGNEYRAESVIRLIGRPLYCLGTTKNGHPRHPLYVPSNTGLAPFAPGGKR
jgi:hypothetical protein